MKISKFFAALFALVGIVAGAGTVWLCLNCLDQEPVLVKVPQAAVSRVDTLFRCVCEDDYEGASRVMYGSPDLGGDYQESSAISGMIWEAYVDSLEYELSGDCQATSTGVSQKVTLHYLDITSVTDGLQERSRELLQQRVAEAEDVEEIYDENNDYRQDFVDAVVADAAKAALREDAAFVETELTVELVYDQGQWWVLADDALMQAISGGVLH